MACASCALKAPPSSKTLTTGALIVAGILGLIGYIVYDRKRIPSYN